MNTAIANLPGSPSFASLASRVKASLPWLSRQQINESNDANRPLRLSPPPPQSNDDADVANELLKHKIESLTATINQQTKEVDDMAGKLEQAGRRDAEKEMMIRSEREQNEERVRLYSEEKKVRTCTPNDIKEVGSPPLHPHFTLQKLHHEISSLRTSQDSLKSILSSVDARHKDTVTELSTVKSKSLASVEEAERLSLAKRHLEVDVGRLKSKNEAMGADATSLRHSVKSLKSELSLTSTELTKRTLEVNHANEKMTMLQEALKDSKALVKATSEAASAEAKRSSATAAIISTLRSENMALNGQIDGIRKENSEEISKLNLVIGKLDVEKRRIEIVSSNLAEELHALKGNIDSPPPYAYPGAPVPRYAPLELRQVDSDSIISPLPVTPVSATKRKAEGEAKKKKKGKKSKKKKTVSVSTNPNCSVCGLGKFGLMVACKPASGDPCEHGSHCHVGCVGNAADGSKSQPATFVCELCQ